jgi:hypothetical protein
MLHEFDHCVGGLKIVSLAEGNGPASVNQTLIAFQPVRLNESVRFVW